MDKFKKTHIDDIISEFSPVKKVLFYMGWHVLARLWNEAEQNEDFELCLEIKKHFDEHAQDREQCLKRRIVPHSEVLGWSELVEEEQIQDYIVRAKIYLKIEY